MSECNREASIMSGPGPPGGVMPWQNIIILIVTKTFAFLNTLRTGLLICLNARSRGLTLGTVRPVYRDRRFATPRERFLYI